MLVESLAIASLVQFSVLDTDCGCLEWRIDRSKLCPGFGTPINVASRRVLQIQDICGLRMYLNPFTMVPRVGGLGALFLQYPFPSTVTAQSCSKAAQPPGGASSNATSCTSISYCPSSGLWPCMTFPPVAMFSFT